MTSSLSVLLKGMVIQKGSFYGTSKSKHKVLVEAYAKTIAPKGTADGDRRRAPSAELHADLLRCYCQVSGRFGRYCYRERHGELAEGQAGDHDDHSNWTSESAHGEADH